MCFRRHFDIEYLREYGAYDSPESDGIMHGQLETDRGIR